VVPPKFGYDPHSLAQDNSDAISL